ncbi:MAG TPA: winged helix DNA-binding protein [Steroidobacteraceae bacterium]
MSTIYHRHGSVSFERRGGDLIQGPIRGMVLRHLSGRCTMVTKQNKKDQAERSIDGERLSEVELALTVLWNSVHRWLSQCSQSSSPSSLSDLDTFLLHLLVYRNKPLRNIDLAFALSIDDMHLVSYSLKKLARLSLITGKKTGKEVFYEPTEAGKIHFYDFFKDRKKYLEPVMSTVAADYDLAALAVLLRTLSGAYEQAARAAASARGI